MVWVAAATILEPKAGNRIYLSPQDLILATPYKPLRASQHQDRQVCIITSHLAKVASNGARLHEDGHRDI